MATDDVDQTLVYSEEEQHGQELAVAFRHIQGESPSSEEVNFSPPPLNKYQNPFDSSLNFAEGFVSLRNGNIRSMKLWLPRESGIEARETVRGTLVLFHGYGGYSLRFIHVAEFLTAEGFRVVAMDVPFHGKDKGFVGYKIQGNNNMDLFVEDAVSCVKLVSEKFSDAPMFLFGHSMGGLIAAKTCLVLQEEVGEEIMKKLGLIGVVFSSPVFFTRKYAGVVSLYSSVAESVTGLARRLAPNMKLGAVRPEWLSHDEKIIEAATKDEKSFAAYGTLSFLRALTMETKKTMYMGNGAGAKMMIPFVIFQGADDQAVDVEGSRKFVSKCLLDEKHKMYIELEGCKHDVFNEAEPHRSKLLQQLLEWMNQRISETETV